MYLRTVVLALALVTATAARHLRTTRTTPAADFISFRSTSPTTHERLHSPTTTPTERTPSTKAMVTKQGNPTSPATGTTSNTSMVLAAVTTIPNTPSNGSTPSLPTAQTKPSQATTRILGGTYSTPAAPTSGSRKSTPTSSSATPIPTVSTTKALNSIVSILSTSTKISVSSSPAEGKPMAPVPPTTESTTSATVNVTPTSATGSGQIEHTVVSNIKQKLGTVAAVSVSTPQSTSPADTKPIAPVTQMTDSSTSTTVNVASKSAPASGQIEHTVVSNIRQKLGTVVAGVPNLVNAIRSKRPMQSVAVSGQLLCNGEPATEVELKLYDHDTFTPNDLMATNSTDEEGRFRVAGYEHEFTQITPQLDILHSCGGKKDCLRKLTIYVPKNHVTKGDTPGQAFDIGSVELFGRFSGETTNCFQ